MMLAKIAPAVAPGEPAIVLSTFGPNSPIILDSNLGVLLEAYYGGTPILRPLSYCCGYALEANGPAARESSCIGCGESYTVAENLLRAYAAKHGALLRQVIKANGHKVSEPTVVAIEERLAILFHYWPRITQETYPALIEHLSGPLHEPLGELALPGPLRVATAAG